MELKLGGQDGSFCFKNIRLWRDIYYVGRDDLFAGARTWKIPSGHFFVAGDNSLGSRDSRDWKKFRVVLKDGAILEGDQHYPPKYIQDTYQFVDRDGCRRVVPVSSVRDGIEYGIPVLLFPDRC